MFSTWQQHVKELPGHLSIGTFSNGLISWLFGVTGPLLIVLQSANMGHLSKTEIISWIFGIYAVAGIVTLFQATYFRQPIGYAFSIPGAVLVGASLAHHTFSQVIGAYLITGVLIFVLGLTGIVDHVMNVLPMPIMMGMVSGVLLPFGTDMFHSVIANPILNGIPLLVFLVLTFFKNISQKFPPLLGAILSSVILLKAFHYVNAGSVSFSLATPHLFKPSFDWSTMGELVLPLTLTVIAIQNAQGIAVLKSTGYHPPVNSMTTWSGVGSILNSFFGAHTSCVAGPMTAILSGKDSGAMESRFMAAVILGVFSLLFGLFAPTAASLPNLVPTSMIQLLGGLAMVGVLTESLHMSFSANFKKGALFSFLITVSGISLFHIGAPFWGLIGGTIASLLLEKQDFFKKN